MKETSKHFAKFLGKWLFYCLIILVLWFLGIFKVIAISILLFSQEFNKFLVWVGEPTEGGAGAYWSQYWMYWMIAYIALFIMFLAWWFIFYRNKRPHLEMDGLKEGRVIWIKGIRQGLIYDFWDAYNYLKGADSPFARVSRIKPSSNDMEIDPGTLKDPLSIPIGRETQMRIIYFSRPWSIKMEKLILPNYWQVRRTYWKVSIPRGYMINLTDPLIPGSMLLTLTKARPSYKSFNPDIPVQRQIAKLEETRELVQYGVAANPEIAQIDYAEGSLPQLE